MIQVYSDVEAIENIMDLEGFERLDWLSQIYKEGQLAGWAKPVGDLFQWHVRLYQGGLLDSEIEPHRKLVAHGSPADPYYGPLQDLLYRWGTAHQPIGILPPDPTYIEVPSKVEWGDLILGILLVAGALSLSKKSAGTRQG